MRISLVACTLLSLAAFSGCRTPGADESDAKIANGQIVTDPNQLAFKSTVALLQANGGQFCSGTLVDKNIVVSAAHCFNGMEDKFKQEGLSIGFGTGPNYNAVFKVTRVRYHKGYALISLLQDALKAFSQQFPLKAIAFKNLSAKKAAGQTLSPNDEQRLTQLTALFTSIEEPMLATPTRPVNDVSILEFQGTAPAGFQDVDLSASATTAGATLLAAGYGLTSGDQNGQHGILRQALLKVQSINSASLEIRTQSTNGSDTCKGDSGGPIYVQNGAVLQLMGITSRTPTSSLPCGQSGSVFTDAHAQGTWIACHAKTMLNVAAPECGNLAQQFVEIVPAGAPLNNGGNGDNGTSGGNTGIGQCLSPEEGLELALLAIAKQQNQPMDATSQFRLAALTARYQQFNVCQQATPT